MAKMTKGAFSSMTAKGMEQRSGYLFEYEMLDGTKRHMGTYKNERGTWWVVDIESGLGLCTGDTSKKAVELAESDTMRQRFAEAVEKMKAKKDEPKHEPKREEVDVKAVRTALIHRATDQAAADPDGRVQGGNCTKDERDMLWRLEKADRLGKSTWGDFTNWYLDGEFVCCIERRWSKRKIHLTYPELKPFLHFGEHKKPEQTEKMKERIEEQAKAKAGADVKATVAEVGTGITAVTLEPPKPKAEKPKAPKKEPVEQAAEVSLESMRKWCEGKNAVATQKREGCPIWIEGDTKPFQAELKEMGFRWAPKRKGWYLRA